jgi:N-ethylmaleimide reductase
MSDLFSPMQLGALQLSNRIVMAPLTRCRADADHVPTPMMADYYAQRASAGLIIAEATMVAAGNSAFWREPGIYSAAQVQAWQQVTDAVHAKGGKIVLQIWHGGRACHPALNHGNTPVSAAAVAIDDTVHTPEGKLPYTVPRVLADEEIPDIIAQFRQAAINAKAAGFDGVEVHGANGYLLDQFLRDGVNNRSGRYGGSLENRSRLLLEVVSAVVDVWGADRVGVRISPLNSFNSMIDADPLALTRHVAAALNPFGLAYLHLMRADFFGVQQGDVVTAAREAYQGNLMGNMGYQQAEAQQALASGQLQAVAVGAAFIANPDLVARWQHGWPLTAADQSTFYTQDAQGYSDYQPYTAQ